MMKWFLLCMLIIYFQQSNTCENNVIVKIRQGELAGKLEKTLFKNHNYYSFKGIPYALPPIGGLRLKAPVRHDKWDGIYEAFAEKPTCLQFSSRQRNGEPFGISGSEDCLYLNVFTPNLKGSAAVMVFDYNDNFKTGFNGTKTYSPDFFVEEDVLVVTINHRLGLFGYLTTDDNVIPGNNGLRDFILGLNWIKENIEQFGGDPNKVTLMGNRGGAVLIDTLLYSAKAKNLFSAAILQSGTSIEPFLFYDKPREAAFELGQLCEINTTDSTTLLEGLQKIDVEDLITKDVSVIDQTFDLAQMVIQPFSPIVEKNNPDAVLTFLPESGLVVNDVPVIIGMNSREGLDLASPYLFEPRLLTQFSQDFFVHLPIRTGFRFDRNSSVFQEAVKEIQNFYLAEGYLYYNNILEYAVYVGDILQNYALNLGVEKLNADLKSAVYYYIFDFRGSLNENLEYMSRRIRFPIENWGATITDELCYLHLCTRIKKNYIEHNKMLSEQPEMKVLKRMVRLWTNFAKHRNPTPDASDELLKDFTWMPVNKGKTNYLHITKKFRMKENPMADRVQFWDKFIAKYSKLSKDGVVKDESHDEL